jgi:hypothetical protein
LAEILRVQRAISAVVCLIEQSFAQVLKPLNVQVFMNEQKPVPFRMPASIQVL